MSQCLAKDRNNTKCRNYSIKLEDGTNSRFCNNHQYMNDYTNEQLNNTRLCSCCKKHYYFPDSKIKQCSKCKERSRINREKKKENEVKVLCAKDGCKYKRSIENKYCNLHQRQLFEDEVKEKNNKCCYNVVRGCYSVLSLEYGYSKCPECLEKERDKDRQRRNNVLKMKEINKNICIKCKQEFNTESFKDKFGKVTKNCNNCREKQRILDSQRDPEYVKELSKINEKKIDRKEFRLKKGAKERSINYELTNEEYKNMINRKCFYCGIKENISIDRIDSKKNYTFDNTVPCCKMCNYLKGSLTINDFFDKIKNILVHNKIIIDIKKYNESLNSIMLKKYKNYYTGAKKRNLSFDISESEFENLIKNDCYLCGIKTDEKHKNGVDRLDNNIGYIITNCNSCCVSCNYMKRIYNLGEFLNKLKDIHEFKNRDNKANTSKKQIVHKKLEIENKIDEKLIVRKSSQERKKLSREKLKQTYGEEGYKKINALNTSIIRARKDNKFEKEEILKEELIKFKNSFVDV